MNIQCISTLSSHNWKHGSWFEISVDLKCFLTGGGVAATSRTEYWYCESSHGWPLYSHHVRFFFIIRIDIVFLFYIFCVHILIFRIDIVRAPPVGTLFTSCEIPFCGEKGKLAIHMHTPNRGYALNDYYQQLLFPPIKGILSWINDIATIWIYIQNKRNNEHKVSLIKVMTGAYSILASLG